MHGNGGVSIFFLQFWLGGQQQNTTMCSPVASSPDLTCMDKPTVHGFRSYTVTSCGSLPMLSSGMFGMVSISFVCSVDSTW